MYGKRRPHLLIVLGRINTSLVGFGGYSILLSDFMPRFMTVAERRPPIASRENCDVKIWGLAA